MKSKILTFDPKKKKTVLCGEYVDKTFIRKVEPKHFMKVMQGYGIQEVAFQEILGLGCTRVIMKTKTDEYFAPISLWIEKGRIADYSAGKQRFLSLKFMKIRKIRFEQIDDKTMKEVEFFEDLKPEQVI